MHSFRATLRRIQAIDAVTRTVLIYLAAVIAWLVITDWLLATLPLQQDSRELASLSRRVLFLVLTASLLRSLLQRYTGLLLGSHRRIRLSLPEFQLLFAKSTTPILIFSETTQAILAVNEAAIHHYGFSRGEFLRMRLQDLQPPEALHEIDQPLARAPLETERFQSGSLQHWNARRQLLFVDVQTDPIRFRGRQARLMRITDVTERVSAQREIARLAERLDEATRIAQLGYWEYDAGSGAMHWSEELQRILNAPAFSTSGSGSLERFLALVSAGDAPRLRELFHHSDHFDGEFSLRETPRHLCIRGRLMTPHPQRRLRGTIMDISDRRTTELRLEESETLYRQLVALLPDAVLIVRQGRIVFASRASAQVFGTDYAMQLLQRDLYDLVAQEELDWAQTLLRRFESRHYTESDIHTRRLLKTNGEAFDAEIAARAIQFCGKPAILVMVRCITQRLEIEHSLKIANQRLSLLSTQVMDLLDQERHMISRELHDDIGQALTAMDLSIGWIQKRVDQGPVRERLDMLSGLIEESVAKVRNLSLMLRPPQLDALGLTAAVEWKAERLLQGLEVQYQVDSHRMTREPSPDMAQIAFRITQECLTNILRHAQASRLYIGLSSDRTNLYLEVRDNGRGFDVARVERETRSLGLLSMRERAMMAGGRLDIISSPGEGTQVSLTLPLHKAVVL